MDTCNEKTLCRTMAGAIEPHEEKPGFHLWRKVEGGRIVVKGILYKSRKKDANLIALNRCPWCEAELKWGMTANSTFHIAGISRWRNRRAGARCENRRELRQVY